MLPKFLFADNYKVTDKVFIIHNEKPRFIVECSIDEFDKDQVVNWIDEKPSENSLVESLLVEAEEYYNEEFDFMENYEDEDEDEEK